MALKFNGVAWIGTAHMATLAAVALFSASCAVASTPKVGDKAADFELEALGGGKVKLSALTKKGPVALIVLRGYPGYQCPLCSAQVAELLRAEKRFADAKTQVLLVYPGPADGLKGRASEFAQGKTFPRHFRMVLDPNYKMVNQYGLRWDASGETAYPSSFVIDSKNKVLFAKVSRSHGDRATADELLQAVPK